MEERRTVGGKPEPGKMAGCWGRRSDHAWLLTGGLATLGPGTPSVNRVCSGSVYTGAGPTADTSNLPPLDYWDYRVVSCRPIKKHEVTSEDKQPGLIPPILVHVVQLEGLRAVTPGQL